jgi:hypothetical protein
MHRVTSCSVGSFVALVASACQLVPNPALIGGDTSTGVDAATSSSTSAMDGVDTTGPVGSTSSGPQGSTSSGPAEQLWCMDVDGDGFGDPTMCMQAVDMPPGTVDDDEDCDDGDPDTFPGAAPLDDPAACMHDADEDEWGDDTPPAGVDAGTDCDDTDDNAFPGAAENEDPPDQCTVDADGDGWGDANPGGGGGGTGPQGGSDCYDANPDLNPDTLQLTAFVPFGAPGAPRMLMTVDTATAVLAPFVTLEDPMGSIPDISVSSATMDANGMIFANDFDLNELHTVSYADTCGGGTGVVTGLGSYAPPTSVSGLELAGNGTLYGISNDDHLYAFDPITGQVIDDIPLALDVDAVGMAYDCVQDRLLFANGSDWSIYRIDRASGVVTLLRDLSFFFGPAWSTVGLAWDPVSRTVYLSTGNELYDVDLDMASDPMLIGTFSEPVSNLAYLPICSP